MQVGMRIAGLNEFIKDLRTIDRELPKELKRENKAIADALVPRVKAAYSSRYTRRSGAGVGSIRSFATQKSGGIRAGSKRAPYMPGQEWGSDKRKQFAPRAPGGRFLRPTMQRAGPQIEARYREALVRVMKRAVGGVR